MASTPISVASFTHFGYPKDLKSQPTYYSIKSLANEGFLRDVFVVDVEQTFEINPDLFTVPIPGGKSIPRLFYLMESVIPQLDAREATIRLFDYLTSRKIGSSETLHSFPHLVKTLRTAQAAGTTTVVYASSSHPLHVQNLLAEERERYGFDFTANPPERILEGFNIADYILYLNEYSRETFIEYGFPEEKLIKVGPLAANLEAYSPTEPSSEEFTVLSVANMNELKGVQYLIDAWERLDLPDSQLVLCGTMNEEVRKMVSSKIDRNDDIEHVGYVDEPAEYYRQASVLVHPSLSESFAKVVAEAMASSVPVVITEHGPREYVDNAGFVVPIRDSEAIADRIRYLYQHPEEAQQMGQRGREIAEANTWDDFSKRVKKAHKKILKRES